MALEYGIKLNPFADGVKITCDKCGDTCTAANGKHNDTFYMLGWSVSPKAKKYIHLCYNCKTKKQKKATDFVRNNFPA